MKRPIRKPEILIIMFLFVIVSAVHAQVVRQLTRGSTESLAGGPALDDSGGLIAAATTETTVTNPYNEPRISNWSFPGAARTEVYPFRVDGEVSLSDDGRTYAFVSREDLVGQNPDGGHEIYVASADGGTIVQITDRLFEASSHVSLQLAGSGNRLVFVDTTDPDGTAQLFLSASDGTGIVQLTHSTDLASRFRGTAISDDGQQVVFAHDADLTGANPGGTFQLFRVEPDGSGLTQLTTAAGDSDDPQLSGGGTRIAYRYFDPEEALSYVRITEWADGFSADLAQGHSPTITDDGQWVYYIGLDATGATQVFRIRSTGASPTQVTDATNTAEILDVVVSGDDTRLAIVAERGAYPGGDNPDGSRELIAMDPDGASAQQLTALSPETGPFPTFSWEPDVTPDGRGIVFSGLFPDNAYAGYDLSLIASDGTGFSRLTHDADVEWPGIREDGTITFGRIGEICVLPGGGGTGDVFVYRAFRIEPNGSVPSMVLPPDCLNSEVRPAPARRSDLLTYQGGPWGTEGAEVYVSPLDGSSLTPITNDADNLRKSPRIDYGAEWVVYHSGADGPGASEVYRARADGTDGQQLSFWGGEYPDLSADGGLVVYESSGDPLGLNADGNSEIFLFRADTQTTEQLTVTTNGVNVEPRISGNGAYVYFTSTVRFSDEVPGEWHLYRIGLATGELERADGLADPAAGAFTSGTPRNNPAIAVDESGDRAVYTGHLNSTGINGNLISEVFFVDFSGLPKFEIGGSSPTVLRWEPDPRGVRYDVIRGDLANLTSGAGMVGLGPVSCLAQHVADPASTDVVDPEMPAPGQGFFFLYRWSDGTPLDRGSWGQGSGGFERLAGAGECNSP